VSGAEIAVVLGASLLGAFVKSVTGMGYPLLAVPLIALALGIEDAVVIVSGPNAVANFLLCWQARGGRGDTRDLPALVGTSFFGAFLGTFLLVTLPEDPLLIVLAVTIIFGVAGSVQLVLLAGSGRYTTERLGVSVLALIPVLLMIPVGMRSRTRLGGRGFDLAVLGVLLASGAALVLRVLG
jgi:hypothetical protein